MTDTIASSVDTRMWADGSVTLVLPFSPAWVTAPDGRPDPHVALPRKRQGGDVGSEEGPGEAVGSSVEWSDTPWPLTNFRKKSRDKVSRLPALHGAKDPLDWFGGDRFRAQLEGDQAHLASSGVLDHPMQHLVDSTLIAVRAVERVVLAPSTQAPQDSSDEGVGALFVHAQLTDQGLANPTALAMELRYPAKLAWIDAFFRAAGVRAVVLNDGQIVEAGLATGRTTPDPKPRVAMEREVKRALQWRPYLVSHLVPLTSVPDASAPLPGYRHWKPEDLWGWRMASAVEIGRRNHFGPGLGEENRDRRSTWLGASRCRAEARGLAIIGTDPLARSSGEGSPDELNGEHVMVGGYVHQLLPRLHLLVLRQHRFLSRHSDELANVSWNPGTGGRPEPDLDHAFALEQEFMWFRNKLWMTHIPGRSEETRLLQAMQSALDISPLVEEISDEHGHLTRIAEQLDAKRRREQQEHERGLEAQVQKRRERFENAVAFIAVAVTIPDLVFAGTTVATGEGGGARLGVAVVVTLVVMVLTTVLVRRLSRFIFGAPAAQSESGSGLRPGAGSESKTLLAQEAR